MDVETLDFDIETLDRLARIVRAAEPERFRMDQYFQTTACGTAACIAGHGLLDRGMRERLGLKWSDDAARCGAAGRDFVSKAFRAFPSDDANGGAEGTFTVEFWSGEREIGARWFLFHEFPYNRHSEVDDAPFAPTPAENVALGADYARGLAEREAALNRLGIVRACLVKWRAALAPVAQPALAECAS